MANDNGGGLMQVTHAYFWDGKIQLGSDIDGEVTGDNSGYVCP